MSHFLSSGHNRPRGWFFCFLECYNFFFNFIRKWWSQCLRLMQSDMCITVSYYIGASKVIKTIVNRRLISIAVATMVHSWMIDLAKANWQIEIATIYALFLVVCPSARLRADHAWVALTPPDGHTIFLGKFIWVTFFIWLGLFNLVIGIK